MKKKVKAMLTIQLAILSSIFIQMNCVKIKVKGDDIPDEKNDYDPRFHPNLWIYSEEPDRDPFEVYKWKKEQKEEKAYIKKMEKDDKSSVEAFRRLLAKQKSQLGKINALENSATNVINKTVGETPIAFAPWS